MQNQNRSVVPMGRVPQDNALNGHPRRRKTGQGARLNQSKEALWKKPTLKDFLGVTPKEFVEGDAGDSAPTPVKLLKSLLQGSLWSSNKNCQNEADTTSGSHDVSLVEAQEQQTVPQVTENCDAPTVFTPSTTNNLVEPQTNFEKYLHMKQLGGAVAEQQWQQHEAQAPVQPCNVHTQLGSANSGNSSSFVQHHWQMSNNHSMHPSAWQEGQQHPAPNGHVTHSPYNSFSSGNLDPCHALYPQASSDHMLHDMNSMQQLPQLSMPKDVSTTPQSSGLEWNTQSCIGGNVHPNRPSTPAQLFQALHVPTPSGWQQENPPNWFSHKSYLPQIPEFAHMTAPVNGAPFHPGFSYATEFKYYYNYYPAEEYVGEIDGHDPKSQEEAVARAQSEGLELDTDADIQENSPKAGLNPLLTSTKRIESGKAIPLPLHQ